MLRGDTYMEENREPLNLYIEKKEIGIIFIEDVLAKTPKRVWVSEIVPYIVFIKFSEAWGAAWQTLETKHGAQFMQKFWNNYASENAYKDRSRIIDSRFPQTSKDYVRKVADILIYPSEHEYLEIEKIKDLSKKYRQMTSDKDIQYLKNELAEWLLDCIEKPDPAALRNLANSLNENNHWQAKPLTDDTRLKPRLLHSFCKLLQENRAIPTRVELEDAAGIIRQVESGKASSKNVASALKSLGLDVLPK